MEAKTLIESYLQRQEVKQTEADVLRTRYERYSLIRLGVFFGSLGAIIYLWSEHGYGVGIAAMVILATIFGFLVRTHQRMMRRSKHLAELARINGREAQALQGDFSAFADGKEFLDPQHPYGLDLDLFGPFSLFQFINRTTTSIGTLRLANFLAAPASRQPIAERQTAIQELADQLEWRQDLQAIGSATPDTYEHVQQLKRWMEAPDLFGEKPWLKGMLLVAPILTIASLVLWYYWLPWYLALLLIVPNVLTLRNTLERVNKIHDQTAKAGSILRLYARLMEHLAIPNFASPLLRAQQEALLSHGGAARQIKRLSYVIEQLNVRYNFFAIFLNMGFLWDLWWVQRLEKWKRASRESLPAWFDALATFDALQSLATLAYNHPDWSWPRITEQAKLEAKALGHPLILADKRVANDVSLATQAHIMLLTGSNMAGKSTFLRTLGINAVLAYAGAPVCAREFQLPILQVYTSMRTQDALSDSASSFMAELQRLQLIIEAVKKGEPVFFLLDETLKGTNSRDRHRGGKALLKQLIRYGGAGILATHDLELSSLEATSEGAVENWCMEVEIDGKELHFPYRLERGVTESFNASILMERMGIEFEEE
jgi:hypothetical protein